LTASAASAQVNKLKPLWWLRLRPLPSDPTDTLSRKWRLHLRFASHRHKKSTYFLAVVVLIQSAAGGVGFLKA